MGDRMSREEQQSSHYNCISFVQKHENQPFYVLNKNNFASNMLDSWNTSIDRLE